MTSPLINHFPLSVAAGQAFCNRQEETKWLKNCIENLRPVLLVSPRRYGKTSLALHAISQTGMPYAHIDFFSAVDEQDLEKAILKGAGKLIFRMENLPKRALALASEIFEGAHIKTALSQVELSIEVHRRKEKPAYHVLDILEKLEHLAKKTNKKIVLFFDEFQCLGEVVQNHAMEGVLRQITQLTHSIAFIFSGSNRHLLNQMFEDRNRPFYKLCERLTLDRIKEEAYAPHIQKVAKKQWQKELPERVLENLFQYSERHPYYLNLLCSRLLRGDFPTADTVTQLWEQYILEERSSVGSEIELLSKNQRKLLTVLARTEATNAPLGKEFVQQTNISKATVEQALEFLMKKDYVYKDNEGYVRVLDPLIKSVLE